MGIVKGTDMMLYWFNPDTETDIPFACSTSCTFNSPTDVKEVTNTNSAWFREFKYDIAGWFIECNGFIILENFSYLFLLNIRKNREKITVKFTIDNGTDGLVIVSGQVLLVDFSLVGNYNEGGTYSCTLQGSGAYNTTGATITPGGIVVVITSGKRFEYTVLAENTSITVPELNGALGVLSIVRGTQETPEIVYTGTPDGGQIKATLSGGGSLTGELVAPTDNPFLAGEIISGIYFEQ